MKTNQTNETTSHSERRFDYKAEYFHALYPIEDKHFWFSARNHVIGHVIDQIVGDLRGNYRVLEIGTGNGNALRILENHCPDGSVFGMDVFMEGFDVCQKPDNVQVNSSRCVSHAFSGRIRCGLSI